MARSIGIVLAVLAATLLLHAQAGLAGYDTQLYVQKGVYSPGENVTLKGYVYNSSNASMGFANATVRVSIFNSSGMVSNVTFNTSSTGLFYSKSDYYPTASAVPVPSVPGAYKVNATYTDPAGASWSAHSNLTVISTTGNRIDEIQFYPDKTSYYASTNVSVTAGAYMISGGQKIALPNVTINGTLRTTGDALRNSFNCTTGSDGTCTMPAVAAPSTSGTYVLEANDYVGYSTFKVRPFDLLTTMKDGTGSSIKSVFATGEDAYVEAKVFYNSTTPTGNYTVTGYIADANGTRLYTLAGVSLTSSNSYSSKESFRINSSFGTGSFSARLTATKLGGESVSESATFQIKNWDVSVSKSGSDSGFVAEYDAFGNRTLQFEIAPVDRTTGGVIADLNTTTNFTITVENELALQVANATANYNSTCECYKFNITSPTVTGDYFVKVSVDKSGETQTTYSTITVVTAAASAIPSDAAGVFKEQFGTGEFVYIIPSLSNTTASVNITDAELVSLTGPDGALNYTNASSWVAMNLSDGRFEWSFNSTLGRMRLDPPRNGGQHLLKIYVNNRTASAEVKFTTKPYGICMSPKASSDVSDTTLDYYRQFKTTDTIYMQVAVKRASDSSVRNTTSGSSSMGMYAGGYAMSGMYYGKGEKCTISTTSDQPISNATLSVLKVTNVESGRDETLNATASICQSLSTSGTYLCTLQSNGTAWEGGMHSVTVSIVGPDGTRDTGYGGFEAKSFYLNGWATSWRNKPDGNITLQLYMYAAGSGWFSSGKGLSGTVSLEKVEYLGKPGMWMWSSSNYDYNTTGVGTVSISNGQGAIVLNASRAPSGQWSSGSYIAVLKGIDEQGNVDYGRVWFEIRKWDAYAQPVEIQGDSFRYKYDVGTRENVTLYVKISNAGDNWGTSGTSLGGPVTVRVKKLEHMASWPPQEISASNYTANSITVNVSNPDMWSASASTYSNYAINITKTSGRWSPGGYSVMLDINGTEVGYGWFNIISFGVNVQGVDANGYSTYTSKGRGPLYFNVTATKSTMWSGYYSAADYVNATIDGLSIYSWRPDPVTGVWSQNELKYPADLNITTVAGSPYLNMSGRTTLNITYLNGNWPSGWYSGQLTLKNAENDTATGWLGFSIQPFRIDTYNPQYEVSMSAPLNVTLTAKEPDYSSQAVLVSNYSIASIVEETWGPSGSTRTQITGFSPASFNGTSTVLTINPNGGSWSPGWKNLKLLVNDTNTSSTQETWVSFKATAFTISLNRLSGWDIGLGSNVTVLVTMREPGTSANATGNLTTVFAWNWPSRSTYSFVVGNCNSMTSGTRGCTINGTAVVTILPPSGGWEEKYHYLNFEYAPATGTAVKIEDWQSISFYARPSIIAYINVVDDNLAYRYDGFGKNENVTLWVNNIRDLNGSPLTATILNAQYSLSSTSCWDDSCRTYQNASWAVVNSAGGIISNDTTGGYVRMFPPAGGWQYGDYYARIQLRSGSETAVIKNGWFRVVDRSPWNVTISSPAMGQNITSNTIYMSAVTTKNARCYMSIQNFDSFSSWYCSSWSGNNTAPTVRPSICGNTTGYNGTTYYYSWIDSYNTPGYVTGALSHAYNYSVPADMPNGQHYALYASCCDSNWMCMSNATAFYMNRTTGFIIPLWSSQSVNTTTVGRTAGFSLTLRDPVGLSGYIFSTNNSGTWQNDTWAAFPANTTSATMVVNKTLTSTVGAEVRWAVHFNNTLGNWNSTPNFTLTTTADSVPQWSANTTSTTVAGASANFSVGWTDQVGLSGYIFSTNNSGTWQNDTWMPFSGTSSYSALFKNLNLTVGALVQWQVYANNTLNKWNATSIFNLTTTSTNPKWRPGTNTTNTTVAGAAVRFSLNWSDPSGLAGYIFSTNNSGAWRNDTWRPFTGTFSTNDTTLNPASGTVVEWKFYANNSLNQWNYTLNFNLTTAANTNAPKWLAPYVSGLDAFRAGKNSTFNVRWQDQAGMAGYIFSTNNSGAWQNDSWVPLVGNTTDVYVAVNKTLNGVTGIGVSWMFYANNTLGLWNSTLNFSFTTVP